MVGIWLAFTQTNQRQERTLVPSIDEVGKFDERQVRCMHRFLPLLIAVFLTPLGAAAQHQEPLGQSPESIEQTKDPDDVVWLVMSASGGSANSMVTIPTKSMEQCEAQGAIYKRGKFKSIMKYVCLEGIRRQN